MAKRFVIPFANGGDKTVTPDATAADGSISYSQGWPSAYQLPDTDPNYRPVGRQEMNGVLNDVTGAIAELQTLGYPEWVAVTGLVVPYVINAVVRHNGVNWRNTVANNSVEPGATSDTTWVNIASGERTRNYAVDTGAVNVLVAALAIAPVSYASIVGQPFQIKVAVTNTGAVTLNLNSLGAVAVTDPSAVALVPGALPAGAIATVVHDGARFQLLTLQQGFGARTMAGFPVGTTSWVCPPGVYRVKVRGWGAGGTGASGNGSNQSGCGGGGGGYGEGWYPVTPGVTYSVVVGAAGSPPTTASATGTPGGLSAFGSLLTLFGGGGGAVFSGSGGTGGIAPGAQFSITGNAGSVGTSTIGGSGGTAFGSTAALGSILFGNPAQGPGSAGSGALAASAGNSLAANGQLTLEY